MKSNGGIIGSGSSYRRKGAAPTSSGVWSLNNARQFEQSGRPTNEINEMVFLGYYENISSDTTSATQTFSNVSLGPPKAVGKRIIATIGYNQGGGAAAEVGISVARLTIDTAPSFLLGTIIEPSGTSGQERSAVVYWDVPESAGEAEIADITITYNSAFTASAGTEQGTIIGLYYIEDETAIWHTVWNSTIRNNSLGSHAVTYAQPNGFTVAMAAHGGSSTTGAIAFTGATEDFEYDPTGDGVFAGASITTSSVGEATITPTPQSEYGVTTVVTFSQVRDYEAFLANGSTYLAPTHNVTTIPSTLTNGSAHVQDTDVVVAVDISNFTNTDTGVLFEVGGATSGLALAMVSGELRFHAGAGGDTYDGTSNASIDVEVSVVSTTMDNYNGQDVTIYVGVNHNVSAGTSDNVRIGIQGFGGRGVSTTNFSTLAYRTGTQLPSQLFGTDSFGFGQSSGAIADIGTTANYAGTITAVRFYLGAGSPWIEGNLNATLLTSLSN